MRSENVARAVALNDDGRDIRYIANVLGRARSTIHDATSRYSKTNRVFVCVHRMGVSVYGEDKAND